VTATLAERMRQMRTILCCLMLACGVSCARVSTVVVPPLAAKSDALTIWRASETSISNRLAVAQQLLSVGMNTYDVENTLGAPAQRNRHNPGLSVGMPPDKHPRIRWWYDYRFPNGIITVHFLQVMDADRFEAEYQSVSIGSEPVVITLEEQPTTKSTLSSEGAPSDER